MIELSRAAFEQAFSKFEDDLMRYNGSVFRSFDEGVPYKWESYKPVVRRIALERLGGDDWQTSDIGSGRLLEAVVRAIEIKEPGGIRNNLVPWEARPRQPSETARLRDEVASKGARQRFEMLIFDLFHEQQSHEQIVEGLVGLVGRRYSLIAYLFFLYDSERFMPIATTTFDQAFKTLGLELRTAGRCSWANYAAYNEALRSVQAACRDWLRILDAKLIDAHSLLWMMVRRPDEIARQQQQGVTRPEELKRRMIIAARKIVERVAQANGQTEERVVKNKELWGFSSMEAFYAFLVERWKQQEGLCALTGLPMLLKAPAEGVNELVFSVDRIDSSGHYGPDNIQLTCWFANRWKGVQDDAAFTDLLEIVRRGPGASADFPRHFGFQQPHALD